MHFLLAALTVLSGAQRARIDAIAQVVMRQHAIAGLSLGVARGGHRLYLRGYGQPGSATNGEVDGSSVYPIGSLTKQFTAALIMQDAEAGRIGLDRSMLAYLPSANPALRPVTIEQLLTHTGGLGSDVAAAPFAPPGTTWRYDNVNYAALGAILQQVNAADFCTLLRQRIAAPLAMSSTGCADRSAAFGMHSNVPDILTWLRALSTGRIVSLQAFSRMSRSALLANGVATNYGYGFLIADWFGYRVAEHPGYVRGSSAADALVLEDGLEVVALSDGDDVDLLPLLQSIVAIVDPPLDANLAATPGRPPENEEPGVTRRLSAMLFGPAFASWGRPQQIEFVERTHTAALTYDLYRLTFSTGQWWATVGYRADLTIESLSFSATR